ncbi:nuclear valosin-containing protein-like [Ixodes scapularis]|uniref:nuclear valosin-containing protein-like n=1 Tax=Ixodes scapularis TaxID=6945 RepID=UPI001C392B48|nr:nuclear valosin-containing protein-like [Ixodes scapularis]
MNERQAKRKRKSFGGDPRLLPRVKQVLNEHDSVDADDITAILQQQYPEYKRKKRNALSYSVTHILEMLAEDEPPAEPDPESVSSPTDEDVEPYPDKNMVNKSITDLYRTPDPKQTETPPQKNRKAPRKLKPNDVDGAVEQNLKNRMNRQKEIVLMTPTTKFADLGGMEGPLEEICNMLMHLKHPEVYKKLGVVPPRGFLLHGPPGCGKTLLAHAIAGELEMPMIKVAAPEIVAGVSGESEERIRELFDKAVNSAPCIFFIDEIDAVTPKRETAQREMERRIVAQLLSSMDDLSQRDLPAEVLVIGATNRPDSLDPALRRAGRFDREICLGIPDEAARARILGVLCRKLTLGPGVNLSAVAHRTPGHVGADLMALTREATMSAINRIFRSIEDKVTAMAGGEPKRKLDTALSLLKEVPPLDEEQLKNLSVGMEDFESALKLVQPSAKREGFATVPDVTWDDVGALTSIREALQVAILAPVRHRDKYEMLGLTTPTGILLHGPPGCGKTLLAKAIANESGINFISVKGPELLNMYVGESERAVRQCFQRARNSSPCVIFFDELDALCPRRSDSADGGSASRVVNQLLTEMDGLEPRKQVFVLGATNRPDIIDPAMLRPGRLDEVLYVGLPSPDERVEILKTLTRNGSRPPLNASVSLEELGKDSRCDGFSGADLAALVRQAAVIALTAFLKEGSDAKLLVGCEHFDAAFQKVTASNKGHRNFKKPARTSIRSEEPSGTE